MNEELERAVKWMAEHRAWQDAHWHPYRTGYTRHLRSDPGVPDIGEAERGDDRRFWNLGNGARRIGRRGVS